MTRAYLPAVGELVIVMEVSPARGEADPDLVGCVIRVSQHPALSGHRGSAYRCGPQSNPNSAWPDYDPDGSWTLVWFESLLRGRRNAILRVRPLTLDEEAAYRLGAAGLV